tara:strand:- start:309 stop:512 length:204 start_codon:yes stop_codon:yes gene_type:complete
VAGLQSKFIEDIEDAPYADPEPIVPPSVVALIGFSARASGCMPSAFAKREMFDIDSEEKGKAFAFRP